jgi:hypothetical protein
MINAIPPQYIHSKHYEWEVRLQLAACCSLLAGAAGPSRCSVKWSGRQCSGG